MDTSSSPGMCATKTLTDSELIAEAKRLNKDEILDFEQTKSWLCVKCQQCCKWVSVQTYLKDIHKTSEFYNFYIETRQLIMHKNHRGIHLSFQHTCPHLMPGIGCDIYDRRPLSCRQYDGRIDVLMKDTCKWHLLNEIFREEEDGTESTIGQD
jgi:Fe-S-cluster containining protein